MTCAASPLSPFTSDTHNPIITSVNGAGGDDRRLLERRSPLASSRIAAAAPVATPHST